MGGQQLEQPFGDEPFEDVPLTSAPLARVLTQLRFEQLTALNGTSAADSFAAELADEYPFFERQAQVNVVLAEGQIMPQQASVPVWRLRSTDKATTVTLKNGSLTLETTRYKGRTRFCADVSRVAAALQDAARIPNYTRIGLRYTNQISDPDLLERLPELVRRQFTEFTRPGSNAVSVQHSLMQVVFAVADDASLLVQVGDMPPNSTYDPTLPMLPVRSWALDLDSFCQRDAIDADPASIANEMNILGERAYRYFRWAVTPAFLKEFGGSLD